MQGKNYGYIRVSSKEQNIDRQWDALLEVGIAKKNIYVDMQSGKTFNRPKYNQLMKRIKTADCIVITSLDRLGRNYTEIQEQWRIITQVRRVEIVVLDMPLLDTRQNHENLTGKFLADLVLQILSYVAEMERANIKKRQAEGIASAKARGIRFGREAMPLPPEMEGVIQLWQCGILTTNKAAQRLQVSRSWLYRRYKRISEKSM
ncbi:MAG: recombinase family protein [Megasphaera sp.]|jgi:DNA invertase Pin-like site-specific DNA recombinase|nr:recombinase family protein [Megasphaera sp.]MCH4188685.1 recombinase family protein [Megasphaera sp.]MCH4218551.1 recombinase family protein [Megasphaera sp.]